MCPEDLTAAECAVYTAAYGASFSRALAFHTASLFGGWVSESASTELARGLEDAKETAFYVAEQAVTAFRSACGGVAGEPRISVLDGASLSRREELE